MPQDSQNGLRGHFGVFYYPSNKILYTSDYKASCNDFINGYMARVREEKNGL